jgi:hypothetical protein
MSRLDRLDRLKSRFPGPRVLHVGGGRTIVTTSEDRYAMLLAAMGDGDHPSLNAVRAGTGEPDVDEFAQLLQSMVGERVPPSGDPEEPWIDEEGSI